MNRRANTRGFSLVELIAAIVVAGVLAVFATASFDRRGFDQVAGADQVRAIVSYGQKVAVGARRGVRVTVRPASAGTSPNSVELEICSTPASTTALCSGSWSTVPTPVGTARLTMASGIALGGTLQSYTSGADTVGAIYFDGLGRPVASTGAALSTAQTITITGDSAIIVQVDADTGYARRI
jgi:MSHA pilin protein MshC